MDGGQPSVDAATNPFVLPKLTHHVGCKLAGLVHRMGVEPHLQDAVRPEATSGGAGEAGLQAAVAQPYALAFSQLGVVAE